MQQYLRRGDVGMKLVCGRYAAGATMQEIAAETNCSIHTIGRRMDAAGMPRREWGSWSRKRGGPYWERDGWMQTRTRHGKVISIHRGCYEANYGPFPPEWHIHHVDNAKKNNEPENLLALHPGIHTALTLLHRRHPAAYQAALEVLLAERPCRIS